MEAFWGFLGQVLHLFVFINVLDPYEAGVKLRMGRYVKTVTGGHFWFLWPFGIDEIKYDNVVQDTMELGTQSLTTKDNATIQVAPILTYHIFDIKRFLLDVEDADSAMTDAASGYVRDQVAAATWAQVRKPGFPNTLKKHIQKQARKWGIAVTNVQFSSCVQAPSLRLLQE